MFRYPPVFGIHEGEELMEFEEFEFLLVGQFCF